LSDISTLHSTLAASERKHCRLDYCTDYASG
jgi:hypothetical protein